MCLVCQDKIGEIEETMNQMTPGLQVEVYDHHVVTARGKTKVLLAKNQKDQFIVFVSLNVSPQDYDLRVLILRQNENLPILSDKHIQKHRGWKPPKNKTGLPLAPQPASCL